MADNVPITAGSGTTVSTEEVTTLNGVTVTAQHVQRVATAFRTADGVASDAATGAGAVAAGVQRTTLASDDPAVAALGATNSSAAANPSATSGLNGLIKGMWTGLVAGIGAIGDAAWVSGNGSAIAILKTIAQAAGDTTTPVPVFGSGREYETVAASQTAQTLGATGGTGDDIDGILVIPATTSPGVVTLLDNSTSIPVFVGGASSVSNLVPFFIPLGMKSVSGAWKLTTGANVSAVAIGNFT